MRFMVDRSGLALSLLAASSVAYAEYPADKFNLRFWKLTLPLDDNDDGKVDEVKVRSMHEVFSSGFFLPRSGWVPGVHCAQQGADDRRTPPIREVSCARCFVARIPGSVPTTRRITSR